MLLADGNIGSRARIFLAGDRRHVQRWSDSASPLGRRILRDVSRVPPSELGTPLPWQTSLGDLLLSAIFLGRQVHRAYSSSVPHDRAGESPRVSAPASLLCCFPRLVLYSLRTAYPRFPFLGNDFFAACGDCFSCHIIDNPDKESELFLLRSYAPTVPMDILQVAVTTLRLPCSLCLLCFCSAWECCLQSFAKWSTRACSRTIPRSRGHVITGLCSYPYSTRELVGIVSHMEAYPHDGLQAAIENTFSFDKSAAFTCQSVSSHASPLLSSARYDPQVRDHLSRVLHRHGIPVGAVSRYRVALAEERPLPIGIALSAQACLFSTIASFTCAKSLRVAPVISERLKCFHPAVLSKYLPIPGLPQPRWELQQLVPKATIALPSDRRAFGLRKALLVFWSLASDRSPGTASRVSVFSEELYSWTIATRK